MGITFDAPLALLLLIPALGLTVALYLAARATGGRRSPPGGARRARRPPVGPRPGPGRVPARPAGRPDRHRVRRRHVQFGRQRRSRRGPGLHPLVTRGHPRWRRRRDRRLRQERARGAPAVGRRRDRSACLDAGHVGDRHRRGAATGHRPVPGRRPATDRAHVRRQRHDRRRPGRGRPRRDAGHPHRYGPHRPRRHGRGPGRTPDDTIDVDPRGVDRGRSPRSARPSPSRRPSACSPTASSSRPCRSPWSRA